MTSIDLDRIDCGHGYKLTDSCPACDSAENNPDHGARLVCAYMHPAFGHCQRPPRHAGDHENDHFIWEGVAP